MVRILATLLRPDADTATVARHDLLAEPVAVKRSISLTGQYAAVDDMLTGQENLEMMAQLRHLPRREVRPRAIQLLADFDLLDARDRRVATYSGGMKRRLDLAISMVEWPELLFLDEPSTGLDPRSREQLWGTVRRLVDDGVTVLLTTQYLEEADQLADTVCLLDHGRIAARGTPDELKASLGTEVIRLRFADDASYRRAIAGLTTTHTDSRLRTVEVATDGSAAEVLRLLGSLEAAGHPRAPGVRAAAQPGRRFPVPDQHGPARYGCRGDGPMSMAATISHTRVMVTRSCGAPAVTRRRSSPRSCCRSC